MFEAAVADFARDSFVRQSASRAATIPQTAKGRLSFVQFLAVVATIAASSIWPMVISATAGHFTRERPLLQGPPRLRTECGPSAGQHFIDGGQQAIFVAGKRPGQRQVIRSMVGAENTAGKAVEMGHDLSQLVEQARRIWQLECTQPPLPVEFGAGNEHQGEQGKVLRVHGTHGASGLFGMLPRESVPPIPSSAMTKGTPRQVSASARPRPFRRQ